jgi:hypothetical protein
MKNYIENSKFLELCCDLTTPLVEQKFGESTYVGEDDSRFTEEAQDFFNEKYDETETILNKIGGVYSDIDAPLKD